LKSPYPARFSAAHFRCSLSDNALLSFRFGMLRLASLWRQNASMLADSSSIAPGPTAWGPASLDSLDSRCGFARLIFEFSVRSTSWQEWGGAQHAPNVIEYRELLART
jgi:hypothetical protein